jgi:shikimate dehydrogenase
MLPQYGLIGYPLTHSFSPAYFKKKFNEQHIYALYDAFPLTGLHEFPELLRSNPAIEGLNVTIPYKEAIIYYLDYIDSIAAQIGAVNCIAIRNGKKTGYNTDAIGFAQSLNPLLQSQHNMALILGTGGASRAVAYVLGQLGIPFHKVSRNKKEDCITYADITGDLLSQHRLIINTTPLGMYPNPDAAPPLPYKSIGKHHLLYDLIYNPDETKFLSLGKAQGASVKNGFEMLQLQADASWAIWTSGYQAPPL